MLTTLVIHREGALLACGHGSGRCLLLLHGFAQLRLPFLFLSKNSLGGGAVEEQQGRRQSAAEGRQERRWSAIEEQQGQRQSAAEGRQERRQSVVEERQGR